jgi:hypothetical protein
MTRYIAPDEIAAIIPGVIIDVPDPEAISWAKADPYNGDLAYRILSYGVGAVALVVWAVLVIEFVS